MARLRYSKKWEWEICGRGLSFKPYHLNPDNSTLLKIGICPSRKLHVLVTRVVVGGCAKSSFAQAPVQNILVLFETTQFEKYINSKRSTSPSPDSIIHTIPYHLAQSLSPKIQPSISLTLILSSIIKSIDQLVLILPTLYENYGLFLSQGKKGPNFHYRTRPVNIQDGPAGSSKLQG